MWGWGYHNSQLPRALVYSLLPAQSLSEEFFHILHRLGVSHHYMYREHVREGYVMCGMQRSK